MLLKDAGKYLYSFTKRYSAKCCIGFSYGLSFPLTLVVLDLWLKDSGVSNAIIGIFSIFHWPFIFKFMWGVLIENYDIPYLTQKVGRDRSWIIIGHLILLVGIIGMAHSDPSSHLPELIFFTSLTALGDGCKDVALYPYQISKMNSSQLGYVAGVVGFGHRIGTIVTKVSTLYLASIFNWKIAYLVAALSISLLLILILSIQPPKKRRKNNEGSRISVHDSIKRSLIIPFKKIIKMKHGPHVLSVLILYKSADFMMQKMSRPFLLEIGFSKIEIANIVQLYGTAAVIVGGLVSSHFIRKVGIANAMFYFGICHAISFFSYLIFIKTGAVFLSLGLVTLYEAFTGGCVTTAFLAFLYTKCKTGSLYALFWALHEISGILFMGSSGIIVDSVGWKLYFILISLIYMTILGGLYIILRRITL
ncbi:MAG: MFS transporter [Holosporaceae bacterium]|nr:MFS transporter [Holosporaceae bacterium]